ncbi:MAG: helix-turn-helix transcriptional regulator [Acidobacteriota bacterium]
MVLGAYSSRSKRGNLTRLAVELPLLLAAGPKSKAELAQNFGCDKKTIKRLIDELSLHYQITEQKQGREVFYRFAEDYHFRPPALEPAEVVALCLAQKAVLMDGASSRLPLSEYGRSLLGKLRTTLPSSLAEQLDKLSGVYGTTLFPAKDYTPHRNTLNQVLNAAIEKQRLEIKYVSIGRRRPKTRRYDIYGLYFEPRRGTLNTFGYDSRRCRIIALAVDRMQQVTPLDEYFTLPPDFVSVQSYLEKYYFNGFFGEPVSVRLRFFGLMAELFLERQYHATQQVISFTPATRRRPAIVEVEMTVAQGRGLERFILSWLPEVEVVQPDWLRERIKVCCQGQGSGCRRPGLVTGCGQ